jgi:NAD(P)-dependent dehydrogenase (short-subunit alcohol dehydrogenase family)
MSFSSSLRGASSAFFSNMFITLPIPTGDLSEQTIIVTGSNQGLGFEAAKHLVRLNVGKLIMGVRSLEKGKAARQEILRPSPRRDPATIEVWPIDNESYGSVKAFAARAAALPRLDGLLANAGIWTTKFSLAEDNEKTLTVNIVSTFLLILLLVPKMQDTAVHFDTTPRIAIPNSALHFMAPIKELVGEGDMFDRLNDPKTADMALRYMLSKLLVIYAVREIGDRFKASKTPLIINTPNPSYCRSQLVREMAGFGQRLGDKLIARSTEEGSRALVDGLLKGVESNGEYLSNCQVVT